MTKKHNIFFSSLIIMFILPGCAALSLLPNSNRDRILEKEFREDCQWRKEVVENLQKYIGFHKNKILEIFGNPHYIFKGEEGEILRFFRSSREQGKYYVEFYLNAESKVYKVDCS